MDFPATTRCLLAALAIASPAVLASEEIDTLPAQEAASLWLGTIDAGSYGYSWDDAAPLFQAAVSRAEWERAAKAVREPLGAVKLRKLRSVTFRRELPGAPPGQYVVIHYDTDFENRPRSQESITPMREIDGSWKVSGYYIR